MINLLYPSDLHVGFDRDRTARPTRFYFRSYGKRTHQTSAGLEAPSPSHLGRSIVTVQVPLSGKLWLEIAKKVLATDLRGDLNRCDLSSFCFLFPAKHLLMQ